MNRLARQRPSAIRPTPLGLLELAARERFLFSALDSELAHHHWSVDEVRNHQAATMRALLQHAVDHVPLYREKYAAAGFRPSEFESLADLAKVPPLAKEELRAALPNELLANDRARPARLVKSSGSSGIPCGIYRDDDSLWSIVAASMILYRDWCDGKPIDNVLYFLDRSPDSIDGALADLLRTTVGDDRIRSLDESPDEQMRTLLDLRPEFLSTYPSTARNLAIALDRHGRTYPRLRLLHLTSEMLDGRTRRLLERVFSAARIVESYSSTEGGLMAASCSAGRWHVAEDRALLEIDAHGVVLVTDLTNWTTPVIRYRGLGDACRWEDSPCPCGSARRSIRLVAGRITDSIRLPDGEFLSPYRATNALDEITGIYQYQLVQRSRAEIEVRIVQTAAAESTISADIARALAPVLPGMGVVVRLVDTIEPKGRHKVPLVVSHLGDAP
jgi:phenylacetate-CoA ligase